MHNNREKTRIDPLPGEVWRPVKGYEKHYYVSNLGRVCAYFNGAETLVETFETRKKYQRVMLWKGWRKRSFFVHRLVAIAFIDNPNNCNVVNHKNECPYDNRVENLEWCDDRYNLNYGKIKEKRNAGADRVGRIRNGTYVHKEDDEESMSLEMRYAISRRREKKYG